MKKFFAALMSVSAVLTAAAADRIPEYDSAAWHALPGMKEVKEAAAKGDIIAGALFSTAVTEAKKRAGLPIDSIDMEGCLKAAAAIKDSPELLKTELETHRKFAEKGFYLAQRTVAERMFMAGEEGNLEWYHKAAEQGDDVAQYNLGLAFLEGRFYEVDTAAALKYWELSAAQGNAGALKDLGVYHDDGINGKKDCAKGIKYFQLAVEKGSTEAAFILGKIYSEGKGVDVNKDLAIKYFRIAAEKEPSVAAQISRDADMYYDMAQAYQRQNDTVRFNQSLAKAAACGHDKAAVIFQRNKLTAAKDDNERDNAFDEIVKLAQNGNVYAQANLALFWGFENRPEEADTWYCRSLGNGEILAFTLAPSILEESTFNETQKKYLRGVFVRADYMDEADMQYLALKLCCSKNFPEKEKDGEKYFTALIAKDYPKVLYPLLVIMLNDDKNLTDVKKTELISQLERVEKILKNLAAKGDQDAANILKQSGISEITDKK